MKQPNVELVREFLAEETPYEYDFKTLNQCLKDIDDPLERELVFKRRSTKVDDPDACELTMSIMCLLLMSKGHKVEGYEGTLKMVKFLIPILQIPLYQYIKVA